MLKLARSKRTDPSLNSNTEGFGARRSKRLAQCLLAPALAFTVLALPILCKTPDSPLAIIEPEIQQSEDGPSVPAAFRFLPGDTLYFTFQIAGFQVKSEHGGEVRKISLAFESSVRDAKDTPLTEPIADEIKTDLGPEDKNWTPKRRVSFVLPAAVAAGDFRVHVAVKDLFAATETSQDYPFRIGGIEVEPSPSLKVENFIFLRSEDDRNPLDVPAYQPGDSVYARFEMVGFKVGAQNEYRLAYGISVLRPDGKQFIHNPDAANLTDSSFYPAQFVRGVLALKTTPDSARGEYIVVLTVRDEIAKTSFELKRVFSVE